MIQTLVERGVAPKRILEPTCGSGTFLRAAAAAYPAAQIIGIEYQHERYGSVLDDLRATQARVGVLYANAYETDFGRLAWCGSGPLLVVGNPPWVTAAALGALDNPAVVQPPRSNPKALRGLAARTGAANFDVAEFMLLKLLRELRAQPIHLALLVKESVARNVVAAAVRNDFGVSSAEIVRIDARKWFGVAVDACCLVLSTGVAGLVATSAVIRPDFEAASCGTFMPPAGPLETGPIVFRQGIKHDAADVFELRWIEETWRNGYGDAVDVEPEHVYPLIKAAALHAGTYLSQDDGARARADSVVASAAPSGLIVPQTRLGAPTDALAASASRLWRYLTLHADRLAARKSSIYRNAPRFALFGIGPYSFAPWKVAVAGFYDRPRFRVIGPQSGRPVMLGDTSYFVPFASENEARAFAAVCASPAVAEMLAQRMLPGKRPVTKALLDGIDWRAAAATLDLTPESIAALFREGPFL